MLMLIEGSLKRLGEAHIEAVGVPDPNDRCQVSLKRLPYRGMA